MTQKDDVIKALRGNGGMATLSQLYALTDISQWKTKTPYASIRRIVQTNEEFFRIQPGLWGLVAQQKEILEKMHILDNGIVQDNECTHAYYQGIVVEIGNARGFETYIPPQDKNRLFVHQKLSDIASLQIMHTFSYQHIVAKAKYVDIIWFNERKMPYAFFEVEHSTDFRNSLNKFFELQDFRAKFVIIAKRERFGQFQKIIGDSIYRPIQNLVSFADYESIVKQYEKETMRYEMGI